ncbi:MAG: tetratricopeptide repeat protein [Gemmatimonadota bacterium]|nr:tetratricopeptide repeat protein [Gemmatimonadota bacterium]
MADALAKGKKPQTGTDTGGSAEDAFVRGAFKFGNWVQENLRSVLLGLAGLALIAFGAWYYVNFQASVREQAAGELAQLRMAAATPDMLIADVEGFVGRFDGTEAADEGRVVLARLYLDTDQPAEAIRVLSDVSQAADRPLGFASRTLLAAAQEETGDVEAARATWERLATSARFPFQRRQAQSNVARIHADAGRIAEAATIYSAIADEAEEDGDLAEAGVYRIRLGELNGRTVQGS